MRDLTPPQIAKTVENVRRIERTAEMANRTVQGITDRMHTLSSTDPSAGPIRGIQKITAEAKKLNTELEKTAGDGSSGSRKRGFLGMVGRSLAPYIATAAIGGFALSSFNAAAQFGAQQKTFEVLTGSRNRGEDIANQLFQLKQQTVLGPSVYKAAQTLMGFGISDKEVMKDLKMLGDVAMGDADRFQSLALVFSQTRQAGRLTGQDLLQYINAGFNPLGVMVDKWKEMGFRKQYTGIQLIEMMRKGLITSQMVTKAFELATTEGGKFNHMLDRIAETPFGKMQMLKGKWAAFKIDMGNMITPLFSEMIDGASKALEWLSPHVSVAEKLMGEKATIDALVRSITNMNEGNQMRKQLLTDLVNDYPELFSKIDIEKIKNSELLTMLTNVNQQYEKRISLATNDALINEYTTEKNESLKEMKRLMAMKALAEAPDEASHQLALKMRTWSERLSFMSLSDMRNYNPETSWGQGTMGNVNYLTGKINDITRQNNVEKGLYAIDDLVASGKVPKGLQAEAQRMMSYVRWYKNNWNRSSIISNLSGYDFSKFTSLQNAGGGDSGDGGGTMAGGGDSGDGISKGITGGGPRVININGVKFTDKIEIHNASMKESQDELERMLEEMFLRILNSGASVQ
jgi:hypothetical protein